MRPLDILEHAGENKVDEMFGELTSGEFKRVLLAGRVPTKIPTSILSNAKRKKMWKERALEAMKEGNEAVASSLIYEWLLQHRRQMLIDYLELLEVKHKKGETDETFMKTIPEDVLKGKARDLIEDYGRQEVAIYVHYLDFHQATEVFESDEYFLDALAPQK